MVGRNDPAKGFEVLKEALTLINEPLEIHFVGDWPVLESTYHYLTYHGVVRGQQQMMRMSWILAILLLPSLSEGMPAVVLEAKARGLQVIGTAVGAMEILSQSAPPGDASALAEAMTLERDLKQRETLSKGFGGRRLLQPRIESFSDNSDKGPN